jgi:hypothetical protein
VDHCSDFFICKESSELADHFEPEENALRCLSSVGSFGSFSSLPNRGVVREMNSGNNPENDRMESSFGTRQATSLADQPGASLVEN